MKFNLNDYLYPYQIIKLYRSLQKSMYFSKEQLLDIQNIKLRIIIDHAYNNVPYYKELFDRNGLKPEDIQTVKDLVYIPVLTKDTLRKRYDDLIANNYKMLRPYNNSTSGSTGTPLHFLQDNNTRVANFAFFWRTWQLAGYRTYMRWAQVDNMFMPDGNSIWHYNRSLNSLQISACALDDTNCGRIVDKLNRFKPKIVRGFPSALYLLAVYIQKYDFDISLNLISIVTHAETLHRHQRSLIENVFQCKVFDVYSLWEAVCIISECENQVKHQHMEYSAMEILDDNNCPVEVGETGEITATSFYNFAMPFIRYKTRDLASISNSQCQCGKKHLVVKEIDGRIEDLLVTPEGKKIGRMSHVFRNLNGFDYAQIIQNQIDLLEVFLVRNELFQEDSLMLLEKKLRKTVGSKIRIKFVFVNEIKPSSNGKRRLVVNNMERKI